MPKHQSQRRGVSIVGAFIAHPLEMRRSHAWRLLPDDARRVLFRLEEEHMVHGGACNGSLVCTYRDFAADGIRRASIALAIRQCVALGFLEITRVGLRSISDVRVPSLYRVTYLPGRDKSPDPTHDWRSFGSQDDARAALLKASSSRSPQTQPKRREIQKPDAPASPVPDAPASPARPDSRSHPRAYSPDAPASHLSIFPRVGPRTSRSCR